MTKEQALELATVMIAFSNAQETQGVERPPFEETQALAESLLNAPKPTKN